MKRKQLTAMVKRKKRLITMMRSGRVNTVSLPVKMLRIRWFSLRNAHQSTRRPARKGVAAARSVTFSAEQREQSTSRTQVSMKQSHQG